VTVLEARSESICLASSGPKTAGTAKVSAGGSRTLRPRRRDCLGRWRDRFLGRLAHTLIRKRSVVLKSIKPNTQAQQEDRT